MALPPVSDDLMATLFAEGAADEAEELEGSVPDQGVEQAQAPQAAAPPPAQAAQDGEAPQATPSDAAAPTILPDAEARIERLDRMNRQYQATADTASARALAAERQVATLTAERDGYLAVLKDEQVELTPQQREIIDLRAKEAGNQAAPSVKPPTREEIEAGQTADRQALMTAFREVGVDVSKVPDLGLALYTSNDGYGFIRHILNLAVAPYKKALEAQNGAKPQTPQQRRNADNRVPRQNADGGNVDWKAQPLQDQSPRELLREGAAEEARGS